TKSKWTANGCGFPVIRSTMWWRRTGALTFVLLDKQAATRVSYTASFSLLRAKDRWLGPRTDVRQFPGGTSSLLVAWLPYAWSVRSGAPLRRSPPLRAFPSQI